ncbi:MAG: RNA polymerase subunit sigma, partial [Armatimonadota bacterium]
WIRQAISRAINNKGKAIRLPAHVSVTLRRIERVRTGLVSVSGREPTTEELAVAMGISDRKLQTLLDASHELVSLDAPVGENHSTTVGSLITDPKGISAEEVVLTNEVLAELRAILRDLNEREQRVMNFKYRLDGGVPMQPLNLEHELQVTRDRLRQIEARAIGKLRVIVQARRLGELFGRDLPSTAE